MDCDGLFSLAALPLSKLAAISLACYYWERPDIVCRLNDSYLKSVQVYEEMPDDDKGTCSLCRVATPLERYISTGTEEVRYISKQLKLLPIPNKLVKEIKIAVAKIWQRSCYWKHHVIKTLHLEQKYAEKIYWTSHGEIDVLRIINDFWFKDSEFPGEKTYYLKENHLFCTAVILSGDKFISFPFGRVKKQLFEGESTKSKTTTGEIIKKWIVEFSKKRREQRNQILDAGDLFLQCIVNRYEFGARYFWNQLTIQNKNELITEGAEECVRGLSKSLTKKKADQWLFKDDTAEGIKIEQVLKILLFLINEMTEIQKLDFIPQNFVTIFKAMSVTWPYSELSGQALMALWDHVIIDEDKFLKLLINNYFNPKEEERSLFDDYSSRYETMYLRSSCKALQFASRYIFNCMLSITTSKISKELKMLVFVQDDFKTVQRFYDIQDYVSLNIIINDPSLVNYRQQMLEMGVNFFRKCIDYGDYKSVNKFFKVMELAPEESKFLKRELNLLNLLLISGKIKLAEEHLNYISDSDIERNEIKAEIDANEICYLLIQNNQFKKADTFLSWRFDAEEDHRKVKNKFSESLVKRFFNVWCCSKSGSMQKTISICSKLLKWSLESDEEIVNFKMKLKAENEGLIPKYWDASFFEKDFIGLDEFLEFCLFSVQEIKEMKFRISSNINWWIDTYALESYDIGMIHELIWWVYEKNQEKVDEAIANYMKTPQGSLLLIKMFKNFSIKSRSRVEYFLDNWVKVSSNYTGIGLYLEKFRYTEKELDVFQIKYLLRKLEQGKELKDDDFKCDFKARPYAYSYNSDDDDCDDG